MMGLRQSIMRQKFIVDFKEYIRLRYSQRGDLDKIDKQIIKTQQKDWELVM